MKKLGQWALLILFITCSQGEAAMISQQKVYRGGAYIDSYEKNGTDFFVVGETLYLILWARRPEKSRGGSRGRTDSIILSTPLGHNEWNAVQIPGKAYFLGPDRQNELCAIEREKTTWTLTFYDMMGTPLRSLKHVYQYKPRECCGPRRLVPLSFPDGSLVFYTTYRYETSHPILGFFRAFFSGGHGQKPRGDAYLELIPSLLTDTAENSPLTYLNIADASHRGMLVGVTPAFSSGTLPFITHISQVQHYQVVEYELTDSHMNVSRTHEGFILVSPEGISVSPEMRTTKCIAPLPPFPQNVNRKEAYYLGNRSSDVSVDSLSENMVYAFFDAFAEGERRVYIFLYQHVSQEWTTNIIPLPRRRTVIDTIRLYWWQDELYIGLWHGDDTIPGDVVTILHCTIADLQKGGVLTTLQQVR